MAKQYAGPAPVGLTTARILRMDPANEVNTCGNTMHLTGITVCRGLGRPADAPELAQPCEVSAVSGACFALPRRLWQALGGFDADFFTYMEDTDLSLRVRLAGYRCLYVPGAVVYHSYTSRFAARKLYYLERNRLLMHLKCWRGVTLALLAPALVAAEVITWGYALKAGREHIQAKLEAYGWLLRHRAQVRAARARTQQARRAGDGALLAGLAWRLDMGQLAGPRLGRMADRLLNPIFRLWQQVATTCTLALEERQHG